MKKILAILALVMIVPIMAQDYTLDAKAKKKTSKNKHNDKLYSS